MSRMSPSTKRAACRGSRDNRQSATVSSTTCFSGVPSAVREFTNSAGSHQPKLRGRRFTPPVLCQRKGSSVGGPPRPSWGYLCRVRGPARVPDMAALKSFLAREPWRDLCGPNYTGDCNLISSSSASPPSGFSLIGSLPRFETAMLMKRGVGVIEPSSSPR